jgi:ribonuclease P protein component
MLMNVAPNTFPHNRYGVVTSKRLGGAVIRNRVRRLIRETLHQATPTLQQGWDIVLVAHPSIVGQPLSDITRAFDALVRQAGLVIVSP